jgi:LysR family hydrogen peroxide-inducible transcriptional activator
MRDQALAICANAGATEADYRATSLETLVQMVGASSGVTLLPALSLAVENRRGHLAIRPFVRPAPGRTLAIVWRRGAALKTTLESVGKIIRSVLTSGRTGRSRARR